ncbi:ArsR/SmtB family transcription factor [Streptomyces cinnamoneus]|uniref:Transcriptional regulator n=1 Tax=Streptomyces cinnamoneus TaxID=53446 RepID=A0A918TZ19_STRCJ|nr:ArsR family transcriptional regulator [Streptomyces cinnamoneus]GHC72140.1 transcriptional regulator [Streptomyces cinnamoneus]
MIRIHFTAADFAGVRFAPRPAPLQELNTALLKMCVRDDELLYGRWRQRLLRSLPAAVEPLADLVPAREAPAFIDVFSDTLTDGLDTVRASSPELVRSEIERVYARHAAPAPLWIRDLHRGEADAWQLLRRAQQAAFEAILRPVWPLVQDLHHREFARHALTTAEHGIGAALAALVPGSRLHEGIWEVGAPGERDVRLCGRGLVLVPTFHWTGHPLVADLPGRPLHVTYAAGPGLPLSPAGAGGAGGTEEALAGVLGRTRLDLLVLLADEHTTSGLARRLGVSNATVSAHTAALRGAGLISTARAGRAVLHRRTALGALLVQRGGAGAGHRPRAGGTPRR